MSFVSPRWQGAAGRWSDAPTDFAGDTLKQDAGIPRRYRFGTAVLTIDCDSPVLLGWLDDAYADCELEWSEPCDLACRIRSAGDCIVLEFSGEGSALAIGVAEALIRPRRELAAVLASTSTCDGWALIGGPPMFAASGSRAIVDLSEQPEEFAVNLLVGMAQRARSDMAFLHAGGLAIDGRGVMICGRSGSGKSTTTNSVAALGHALLGDETVGLDMLTSALWSFRRTLKLRPGPLPPALARRLRDVPQVVRIDAQGLGCTWVRASELFATPAPAEGVPIDSVFFLRAFRERPAAERFTPDLNDIAELQSLTQSLSAVASWPSGAAARLIRYTRLITLLGKARCYHLDLGSPGETAELIERLVRRT
jgi:hypothetical protein